MSVKPQKQATAKVARATFSISSYLPELLVNIYSYASFDGEKHVLLLCAWKPAFIKFGHIYSIYSYILYSMDIAIMGIYTIIISYSKHKI